MFASRSLLTARPEPLDELSVSGIDCLGTSPCFANQVDDHARGPPDAPPLHVRRWVSAARLDEVPGITHNGGVEPGCMSLAGRAWQPERGRSPASSVWRTSR